MKIMHPADGAQLPIANFVRFDGTAERGVTQVQIIADDLIELGVIPVVDERWTFVRKFSKPGVRRITAVGLDGDATEISRTEVSIHLRVSSAFGYTPPELTLYHLGDIAGLLEIASRIEKSFASLDHVDALFKVPGGTSDVLYFESNLDLDTDGKKSPGIVYEGTHQSQTSLRYPNGESMDSNEIPFFVLPGIHTGVGVDQMTLGGVTFTLGDIGAILYRDKIEFAVFGDFGPRGKIGEGSIALHRSLGHETVRSNGHIRDVDIERDVVTLIFPGSGDGTPQTPDVIRAKGRALFLELGGVLP